MIDVHSRRVPGRGPDVAPLCFVGEAPGTNETLYGRPFVGPAGEELFRMLSETGINPNDCYFTNVFKHQPRDNDVSVFFAKRSQGIPVDLSRPPYRLGQYLRAQFKPDIDDLNRELVQRRANVVVALGATALWALLGHAKISAYVGTASAPTAERPFWVLPTFHPAAVLRQWSYRPTVLENLKKASDLLVRPISPVPGSTPVGPKLKIKINPKLSEVEVFALKALEAPLMAVDVETAFGQIRTISFSLDETSAFVVPFWEPPGPAYWSTLDDEVRAWTAVRVALSGPGTKVFHNAAFDIQYLWRVHGIPVHGPIEDTMVAYHALEPELPKGLGDLGALFLDMPAWKAEHKMTEKDKDAD